MVHPVEEALERADNLLENGQSGRAISTLELVLFRFPDDPRLAVRLAEMYVHHGDLLGSASYYMKALALDPSEPDLLTRMGAILEVVRVEAEGLAVGTTGLPALRRRRAPDMPTIKLDECEVAEEVLTLIPRELVERFRVIPVARSGQTLLLATAQPENRRALEEISFVTDLAVNCAVATEAEITSALQRFYGLGGKAKKKR